MKIYLLQTDWAYGGESESEILYASTDKTKVISRLEQEIGWERQCSWISDEEDVVIEECPHEWFVAYEDGNYNEKHTRLQILEVEVDE